MTRREYKKTKKNFKKEYRLKVKTLKNEYLTTKNKVVNNPPKRPLLEEIGNSVTHIIGAILAVVGFIFLLIKAKSASEYVGYSLYFAGLFLMFVMSALYHAFPYGSTVKRVFRRFDYSSIYLLIGATFSPYLLCFVDWPFGLIFLIIQWTIIVIGITFIAIFGPTRLKWLHFTLYFLIGWSGLIFLPKVVMENFPLFLYTLIGGIVYSIGIIPFAVDKKGFHFIWHFFVLFGALIQWLGIYLAL